MQITAEMVKELRERTGAGMMDCKKALVEADGRIDAAIENMRKSGQAKADKKAQRIAAEGLIGAEVDAQQRTGVMVEVNCETDFVAKGEEFREFVHCVCVRALEERRADVPSLAETAIEPNAGKTIEERRRELVAKIGENIALRRVALVESRDGCIGAYLHGGRIGVLVDLAGGDHAIAKDIAMHIAWHKPVAISGSDMPREVLDKEREILRAQIEDSGKPPEIQEKMLTGRFNKYLREVTLLGQAFVKDADLSIEQYLNNAGAAVVAFMRFEVGEGMEKRSGNFAEEVMAQARDSE